MATEVFKVPRAKRVHPPNCPDVTPVKRRKPNKDRFLRFCDIVLSYTQYEQHCHEELRSQNNTSPLDSGGSTGDSCSSDALSYGEVSPGSLTPTELASMSATDSGISMIDDSPEAVTCFCGKPFGRRPMIECSQCLTWIHLSCAKIRRTNIPDDFTCQRCKDALAKKRKSGRMRFEKKLQDV